MNGEQEKAAEVKVTLLAFLLKACVAALQRFPELNASLDGDDLVLKRYYHVGFAADTPNGLVVPVLRDADRKGVLELARELGELAAKAREGKLAPGDIQGGTFSISSLGGIGGTAFTPIINAPEGGHPGRVTERDPAGLGRREVRAAADAAALALLRPPGHRRRAGGAHHDLPWPGAGDSAVGDAVAGAQHPAEAPAGLQYPAEAQFAKRPSRASRAAEVDFE